MTFWRLRRSSMSMKSMTMMPPRSRSRIWRTISLMASTLVLTMVSSRRVRLADVLAGVDVDGDQRFGLVDDDVAAALQPDFRLERLVDLVAEAELLEERRVLGVELDAADQRGLEAVGEAQDALVLVFGVDPDGGEVGRDLVAQHALDQVEVVIDERRRFAGFGAGS